MFKEYSRIYDLCNADKDYAKEVEYVDGLIRNYRPGANDVLDMGSGTGIHAFMLAKKKIQSAWRRIKSGNGQPSNS